MTASIGTSIVSADTMTTTACNIPLTWGGNSTSIVCTTPSYGYEIRTVSNGFILKQGGTEMVFESVTSLLTYLKQELKVHK